MTFRGQYDENERQEQRDRQHEAMELEELERAESLELRILARLGKRLLKIERDVGQILANFQPATLTTIKLRFTIGGVMAEGPVVLNPPAGSGVFTLDYFDQTGQPMPASFVPPPATFTSDNPAIFSSTDLVAGTSATAAYVTAGVANEGATLTTAEGLALSDSTSVTCNPIVQPPPVLSSIRLSFTPNP